MKTKLKNLAKFGLKKEYVNKRTAYSPKEYRLYKNNVLVGVYNEYDMQEILDAEANGENLIESIKNFSNTISKAHAVWLEKQKG